MTDDQLRRIQKDYSRIAGENVQIEEIGGVVYAFGSELATLRLFKAMPNMRQGFATGRGTWYFCLDKQ